MKLFFEQYQECRKANLVGLKLGEEHELIPAYPHKKVRDYVEEHGEWPKIRTSLCLKFGGECSSGNKDCRKLRGIAEGEARR